MSKLNYIKLFEEYSNKDFFVFIDEGDFDEQGEPEGEIAVGFSTLEVFNIPGLRADNQKKVDEASENRKKYKVVGKVLVKFWEGDREEINKVVEGEFSKDDVTMIYPSL